MVCVSPLNTRIFAGHLVFGEFRAILRGVVVKKIHIFLRKEITVIYVVFLTCTDENGLGTGIVHYRFNNVRYTIPGFFRDMHEASPYRCNRPFGVC